jgi:hypothetical protein
MTKLIINVETGETTERELNSEEIAQEVADQAAAAERATAEAAKAAEKEALLARLGISADEAKLLLA